MGPINEASDIHEERYQTFNGLLALVLYNSFHSDLSEFILKSYEDLHFSSGRDLLLFLCETGIPKIEDDDDTRTVKFITEITTEISKTKKAKIIDEMRRSFKIPNTKLPCLVFFSGPNAKVSYRHPLGTEKSKYMRMFTTVCDAAHAVIEETPPPDSSNAADYVRWREDCITRLAPMLRQERLIQFASNLPFIQLVTLAMKAPQGR
jgi:hypothetical protein